MFKIKCLTKRIYENFSIKKINEMVPFCKLIYQMTLVQCSVSTQNTT